MTSKALVVLVMLSTSIASADSYWLWAIDGRFEESKSPCATAKRSPARLAILAWIGSETFVDVVDGKVSIRRDSAREIPAKQLIGPNGEAIAIWYRGARTWVVTLYPATSSSFASVTLVMEHNAKREGKPVCFERWIAPVSP